MKKEEIYNLIVETYSDIQYHGRILETVIKPTYTRFKLDTVDHFRKYDGQNIFNPGIYVGFVHNELGLLWVGNKEIYSGNNIDTLVLKVINKELLR